MFVRDYSRAQTSLRLAPLEAPQEFCPSAVIQTILPVLHRRVL